MFTYIYLNVDGCWLTSSMPQESFKVHILLNYALIPENVFSEDQLQLLKVLEVNWFSVTYILTNLITNSIHVCWPNSIDCQVCCELHHYNKEGGGHIIIVKEWATTLQQEGIMPQHNIS